jgi:CHASE3 domain sensor protein
VGGADVGGETERQVSGWTVDTLKVLVDERHVSLKELREEIEKRYTQRFDAQEKAIGVAQATAKEYRASANEWRDAMKDREIQFVRKGENSWIVGVVVAIVAVGGFLSTHWK